MSETRILFLSGDTGLGKSHLISYIAGEHADHPVKYGCSTNTITTLAEAVKILGTNLLLIDTPFWKFWDKVEASNYIRTSHFYVVVFSARYQNSLAFLKEFFSLLEDPNDIIDRMIFVCTNSAALPCEFTDINSWHPHIKDHLNTLLNSYGVKSPAYTIITDLHPIYATDDESERFRNILKEYSERYQTPYNFKKSEIQIHKPVSNRPHIEHDNSCMVQ